MNSTRNQSFWLRRILKAVPMRLKVTSTETATYGQAVDQVLAVEEADFATHTTPLVKNKSISKQRVNDLVFHRAAYDE